MARKKNVVAPEPVDVRELAPEPVAAPVHTVIVEGLLRMNPTKAYRTVAVVPQPVTSRLFVYEGKDHEFVGLEKNIRVYRNQTRP